jgi:hypothetical protein
MRIEVMGHTGWKKIARWAALALFTWIVAVSIWSTPDTFGQENRGRRWNPTRTPAGTVFVGEQVCAECHQSKVASQMQSSMGMAMESVKDSKVLISNSKMGFRIGKYAYEITRQGEHSSYTVTDGKETISLPIVYAFGQGKAGQTYVLQYEGDFYESQVSFYNEITGLDLTIGASRTVPQSLIQAVGRKLSKNETLNCFNCHSTGAVIGNQLQLNKLTHGIRCETCHGPGGDHAAAGKAGQPNSRLIFNPARLSGDELTQDFCASCHRGSLDLMELKRMGISNVRFQPYRIFQSKCYSDDKRISCTACHNPHEPIIQDAAYYDAKCLSCHAAGGKAKPPAVKANVADMAPACRVETKDCASCHMPRTEMPGSHFKFRDHYIRIARPKEPYTN